MFDINKSIEKFNNLPEAVVLTIDSDWIADIVEDLDKKHKLSLSAALIALSVGDLQEEGLPTYLKDEFSVSDLVAKRASIDLKEQVLKPLEKRLIFMSSDPGKNMNSEEEEKIVIDMFENNLISEFRNYPEVMEVVNSRIFNILSYNIDFKIKLENALYENEEILTNAEFLIEGKEKKATVAHWLKYFIKLKGTDIFDTVVISSFMSKSENAKRLNAEDMKKLHSLLLVYRNIKFFPNSMPSDDGEGWEIIPADRPEEKSRASKLEHKKESKEDLLKTLRQNRDKYAPGSLERQLLDEEDKKEEEYRDLQAMLKKYPEGSLERQAVEEEIKKIKR